jgi:hypothetical protein
MERWVNARLDERLESIDLSSGGVQLTEGYIKVLVTKAKQLGDIDSLVHLMEHPEARRLIAEAFMLKRSRGAPKRISDQRAVLLSAAEQVGWIREIWQQHYGKWKREQGNQPHAEDIIIRRFKQFGYKLSAETLRTELRKRGVPKVRSGK